jgi:hypothetical protein
MEPILRRSFTARGPFDHLVDAAIERHRAEWAALPWHEKVRRRFRARWSEVRWRVTKAVDHLRGIECEDFSR